MNDILSKPMKAETLKELVDNNRRITNRIQKQKTPSSHHHGINHHSSTLPLGLGNALPRTYEDQNRSIVGAVTPQQLDMNDLTILPSRVQAHS